MILTFPDIKPALPSTLINEPRLQGFAPKNKPSIERVIGLSRTPMVREFEFHVTVADSLVVQDFLLARVRDNKSFFYLHPDPYFWDDGLGNIDDMVCTVDENPYCKWDEAPGDIDSLSIDTDSTQPLPHRYTCQKWSRSQMACNDVKIRVTFKEFYGFC